MRHPASRSSLACLVCSVALTFACEAKPGGETSTPDASPGVAAPAEPTPPKLVVVVVVDQMRADYLERFGDQWEQGFARLREQGRVFTEVRHAHALTETAPGHATIVTGVSPARHGIVANKWYDRSRAAKVAAVEDPESAVLANPEAEGVSSATLLRESVGDWMQAQDPEAVVISLSLKDRAAILMGGKRPDAAIWYDDEAGAFTSSSYYFESSEALPAWVGAYNERGRAEALYGEQGWTLSRAAETYASSRLDTNPDLVATFNDYALTKSFPHVIEVEGKTARNVIRDTPFGDQMTLELAREAIAAEGMGEDEVADLLLLSMSGGDYIGHRYGPNSVEMHDYYLRLDAALGSFIEDLDARLGEDWVLVLTADHGVAPMPEYGGLESAGRFFGPERIPPLMDEVAAALKLGERQRPELAYGHGVDLVWPEGVDEATRLAYRRALAERLRAEPELADAWTHEELEGDRQGDYADAWRRSFHPDRSAEILVQFAEGVAAYPEGTGHGTPYAYDQRVPLIVRGLGYPGLAGTRDRPTLTIDLAPTLAALVGVEPPADLKGAALDLGTPEDPN